jgi:FKBP-type peptidyl-prolyl cis-trans isomerase FkpA
MKNIKYFLMGLVLLLSGCGDDNQLSQEEQLAVDIEIIQQYLLDNSLTATQTASGLHYIVNNPGVGPNPSSSDNVIVTYSGYFTNGIVFDEAELSSPAQFNVSGVILGWQEGLQLMRKEGRVTLFVPSYLAYGRQGTTQIPANSVLIFDITLLDF